MPTVLFHKGSTTVAKKGTVAPAPSAPMPVAVAIKVAPKPAPAKKAANALKVAKPSGAGPRGAAGYFHND